MATKARWISAALVQWGQSGELERAVSVLSVRQIQGRNRDSRWPYEAVFRRILLWRFPLQVSRPLAPTLSVVGMVIPLQGRDRFRALEYLLASKRLVGRLQATARFAEQRC